MFTLNTGLLSIILTVTVAPIPIQEAHPTLCPTVGTAASSLCGRRPEPEALESLSCGLPETLTVYFGATISKPTSFP